MDVIHYENHGSPHVLKIARKELPVIKEDEVMIKIAATNVSGFDIYRRANHTYYSSLNPILGMECSGTITEVGPKVNDWHVGDKVCAFIMGGGYAEFVAVRARRVMTIPKGIPLSEAASLPYAGCILWQSLFRKGNLQNYSSIMIHDACGRCGLLAIDLARIQGCTIFVTTKSQRESKYCKWLGVEHCFDLFDFDDKAFATHVLERTGKTVDGQEIGNIQSKLLCRSVLDLYIGNEPFDEKAKEDFELNLASLLQKSSN